MYTLCGNNCQVVGRLAAATLLAALDSDACCTLCREPSATVGGIVVQYMYVHVCAQAARKDLAALDSAAPPPRTSALGQHNAPSHTRSSATPKNRAACIVVIATGAGLARHGRDVWRPGRLHCNQHGGGCQAARSAPVAPTADCATAPGQKSFAWGTWRGWRGSAF